MSRISGFLGGAEFRLVNRLAEANAAITLDTLRIAAQRRILAPRDEPSTFLALSRLQTQLNDALASAANVTAASAQITRAQTAIGAVRDQLAAIRAELLKDPSQQGSSQGVIDAAVAEINSLAGTTIGNRRLLDGSADFSVNGRITSQVRDVRIYAKPAGATATLGGSVTQAATQAQLVYLGDGQTPAHPAADATFTLTGKRGSAQFTVATSETLSDVATQINNQSYLTGVTAAVDGNQLTLTSVDYGSSAGISIQVTSGAFDTSGTGTAVDAQAIINGRFVTGDGNRFSISTQGLVGQIEFSGGFSGNFGPMTVTGDALRYQFSPDLARPAVLAIAGLQANRLGGVSGTLDQITTGGPYSGMGDHTAQAIRIVDEALDMLDPILGNVDGFQQAAIASAADYFAAIQESLKAAIAETDGYNEAAENALLARDQQLAANALAGLSILNQQRSALVAMLQQIAGLTSK